MRVLAGLFSVLLLLSSCKGQEPVSYQTTPVDRGDIVSKVTASGTLSALVTVQVGSQVSGRIQELLVDFNSVVKKGEVVARIEPGLFETAVEQARANLGAAEGRLKSAEARARDLQRKQRNTHRVTDGEAIDVVLLREREQRRASALG